MSNAMKTTANPNYHSHERVRLKLPTYWETTSLASLTSIIRGITYKKNQASDASAAGLLPILRANNIQSGKLVFNQFVYIPQEIVKESQLLKHGDIVIAMSSGSKAIVGKAALFNSEIKCSFGAFCAALRPQKLVNSHYISWFTHSAEYRNKVSQLSAGANINNLKPSSFEQIAVPLAPLAEQKVIADKLDELLAQVDTLKARLDAIPAILKRFRQSVLAAAVSGKLTEEWRHENNAVDKNTIIQFVENERLNSWIIEQKKSAHRKGIPFNLDSNIKKYKKPTSNYSDELNLTAIQSAPEGWLVSNLDSVSISVTGKTPPTTDEKNWGGQIPFITPSQIKINGHIVAPERYVTDKAAEKTPILPSGSILIVCIGTIGKVGLLEKESAFNQQINALIPTAAVKKEFLFMWAQTLHTWLNKTSSAVVNAAIINKSRLCSAPCPVPPIEEQTEIVRRVEQLFSYADQVEQQVKNAQARVNQLTQSILAKAFRGELTEQWRQDNPELISGDNSAEALLERIKAERAVAKPVKKAKGRKGDA